MELITVTSENTVDILAENVVHREQEVNQYQINIDNYSAMLSQLPDGEWPEDIVQYSSVDVENLPYSMPVSMVDNIINYQYRDKIRKLIRTEAIEQSKSIRVLEALKSQLPADQLIDLVMAAKVRIDAKNAAIS